MSDSVINVRFKIFKILFDNEVNFKRIDYLLSDSLHKNFSDSDVRFIHKVVYGVIRNRSKLDYYASIFYDGKFKKLLIKYKIILRIGIYQLFYMDSVPDYAAVNTTVDLCKKIDPSKQKLINAIMRKISNNINVKDEKIDDLAIQFSHPQWLLDKWLKRWSLEKVLNLLEYNNKTPKIWFRINTLKISVLEFYALLDKHNIQFKKNDYLDAFFYSCSVQELLSSSMMSDGLISVQNPSNGLVVKLLNPKEGQTIFDGCSAPGGKTRYINELTNGKSHINSYDIDEKRINLISSYLKKNNITNINCYKSDLSSEYLPSYDIGLIDVPCTGTGVLSKRVDIRWRRKKEDLLEMNKIQDSILNNVTKNLNPGGILVYSTCSIEEEENWGIINSFLNSNKDFRLDNANNFIPNQYVDKNGCLSIFPFNGLDGIFAARLIKND